MRVLFLTLYPERAASPRYRVMQFVAHLRAGGLECTVASALDNREYARLSGPQREGRAFWYHAKEAPRRLRQVLAARHYDVVFLQKAIMTAYVRGFDRLLRKRARRLIYDLDDAVHLGPPHPLRGAWQWLEDPDQVWKIMAACDHVLAGNEWLRSVAESCGARATVFPTVVDTDRFAPAKRQPEPYRIGWIGNASTTPHLAVAEAACEVAGAMLHLVGADAARVPWPRAEVRPWSLEREVEEIQQFSVGIMPLPKDEWSRGKCALKALQYMACGVPCVATPYGAICDIVEDGVNGLFADSPDEWRNALERLRDPCLRQRLGDAGRATVEAQYSLKRAAPRLRELLEGQS